MHNMWQGFSRKESLNQHMLFHTGDRPFKCGVCYKGVVHALRLKQHMKIHTGEKLFRCQVCDKRFINSSCL